MKSFDVRVIFSSAVDVEAAVTASSSQNIGRRVDPRTLRSTSHPVYFIHTLSSSSCLRRKASLKVLSQPPVKASSMQQSQPEDLPQYGHTHLQLSIGFWHLSHNGISLLRFIISHPISVRIGSRKLSFCRLAVRIFQWERIEKDEEYWSILFFGSKLVQEEL